MTIKTKVVTAVDWGSKDAPLRVHRIANVQLYQVPWNHRLDGCISRLPLDIEVDASGSFNVVVTNYDLVSY